jgi:hypothetical protein
VLSKVHFLQKVRGPSPSHCMHACEQYVLPRLSRNGSVSANAPTVGTRLEVGALRLAWYSCGGSLAFAIEPLSVSLRRPFVRSTKPLDDIERRRVSVYQPQYEGSRSL